MQNLFSIDCNIVENRVSAEELKVLLLIISKEILNNENPNIIIQDYIKNIINHLIIIENNNQNLQKEKQNKEFIVSELTHDRTPGLHEE